MTKEETDLPAEYEGVKPHQYLLLSEQQDRDAAHRWNVAHGIRRQGGAVRGRVLAFLRANVGRGVTGEELRYVSGDRTEWARRVRELRTEHGWPIATQSTGRPDLAVGIYLLQADRQSPEHDRKIPDDLRRDVLKRDEYRCTEARCRWSVKDWNMADPRHLELHHIQHHAKGGGNTAQNLRALCNVCHDGLHRKEK